MSWLTEKQLLSKIRRNADRDTRAAFFGVTSIDRLPSTIPRYPIILIVNTHTHNLPGEHWITVFIDKERRGEIFDSLALPVSNMLRRWMNRFTRTWKRNTRQFQHSLSSSCGAFALYFILHRLHAKNLNDVLSPFKRLSRLNENVVHVFES